VEVLWSSPEIPGFTMQDRLRAIDALLEWSDRLHERQGEARWETSSSVELAERLHEYALSQALSYISDTGELSGGEPRGVVISEAVKEASKRAVWHSHPDDPLKD
jgi:hypothetical protein